MTTPPPGARPPLPERASDTTAEQPWPLRLLSMKMGDYVEKMSPVWIEGQLVELNPRGKTAYFTLRDTDAEMSLRGSISVNALNAIGRPLPQGARVVVHVKPTFWPRSGALMLDAQRMRPVGLGNLLEQLEILKHRLAAEGVFDRERKRPLPFLPRRVGLVTGRSSAAERDVVENARARWPGVRFVRREVAVQGPTTVTEVVAALEELDALADIDVIVIARGGGSVEDLLPFSNETLIRAVSRARAPVVSAIGHEVDTPLLDLVADYRASTPTDAGKRIVPDHSAELRLVESAHSRATSALARRVDAARARLVATTSRPVMTDPSSIVAPHRSQIRTLQERHTRALARRLERLGHDVDRLRGAVRAYSPQSVLDRGYAVVQHRDGRLVMDVDDVEADELLRVRVAHGDFGVRPVLLG